MSTRLRVSGVLALSLCAASCSTAPDPQRRGGGLRRSVETGDRTEVPRDLADETPGDPGPIQGGEDVEGDPRIPLRLRLVDVFESLHADKDFHVDLGRVHLQESMIHRSLPPGDEAPFTFPKADYGLYANPIP